MRLAVGMEGLMTVSLTNGAPVFEELFCSPAEIGSTEALPDKLHRLTGRMEHIFLVETVVAQLIVHQLIGWEIAHDAWILPHQPVGGKQQGGLGELTAMKPYLAYRMGLTVMTTFRSSPLCPLFCQASFSKSTACCR